MRSRCKKTLELALFFLLILCSQIKADASPADTYISKQYQEYCREIGDRYGICPELLEAMIEVESSGNALARNGNCKGLLQIDTTYHKERMEKLEVSNVYDEKGNILVAADYLMELFQEYGDVGTALMVYNGSRGAVDMGERGEFTDYADKILTRSAQLERLHGK